jgi:2-polyprenyl-6-methoxyphenol hydroxylase-like FAD-dependent oxidoreductase
VNLWVAGRRVARAVLGDMGVGLSPFPYALIFPQDEHERVLIERLADAGVKVERRVELLGFEETGSRVVARLRRGDRSEERCNTAYLASCDGAHSTVRETLGVGFSGRDVRAPVLRRRRGRARPRRERGVARVA